VAGRHAGRLAGGGAFGVTIYSAIARNLLPLAHWPAFSAQRRWIDCADHRRRDRLNQCAVRASRRRAVAFAIELVHQGVAPASIVLLLTVLGILTA